MSILFYSFSGYVTKEMCFLNTDQMNSIQMLGLFHMAAFYIEKSYKKNGINTVQIKNILNHIRRLRCEIEGNTRPFPWKKFKVRIKKEFENIIFQEYLVFSLNKFLYTFKNNTHVYDKINYIYC